MSAVNEKPEDFSVRCPTCRQRFTITSDLMDRIVECGGCSARFRINDDVIIRSRKFYPGEKNKQPLRRVSRFPRVSALPPINIATIDYEDSYHPEYAEPASAQRIIAGSFAVLLILATALIFVITSDSHNAFSVLPFQSKLIIASFIAFISLLLLIYANPRSRIKAASFGLLLGAGLVALPFFTKVEIPKVAHTPQSPSQTQTQPDPEPEPTSPEALRIRFGTDPLEKEQARLALQNDSGNAFGIYLTNLYGRNRYIARDFLLRETAADPTSHLFPRDDENYLMVLNGIRLSISQLASIAGKLGQTTEIHPEINVIVVTVNNNLFISGSREKLNDRTNPAFYDLNLLELQSIDIDRIRSAIERLVDADPKIYRTDINKILLEILQKPGINFHDQICRAILNWADDITPAAKVGLEVLVANYTSLNLVPPESLVTLVSRGQQPNAIPVIAALWIKSPVFYEKHLLTFGSAAETTASQQINSESSPLRHSALKILAQIGTSSSLPDLRSLTEDKDPEVRVLVQRAIEQIESR